MVKREHNNVVPKFRVDIDGETENTTPLSPARKEWLLLALLSTYIITV